MTDWIVDLIYYLLWWFNASLILIIDYTMIALTYIPTMIFSILKSSEFTAAFTYIHSLAFLFAGSFITYILINILLGNQISELSKFIKNIFIVALLLVALPTAFDYGTTLITGLAKDSATIFTPEEDQSFAVQLANNQVSVNKNAEKVGAISEYGTKPFKIRDDITNYDIITTRFKTSILNDNNFYYSQGSWIFNVVSNVVILVCLFMSGVKIYLTVGKIILYNMFIPVFSLMRLATGGSAEQSFKNYISQVTKSFIAIALQFFSIYYSIAFMYVSLALISDIDSGIKYILGLIVVFGSLYLMLDGSDAIVDIFGVDVGIKSVGQSAAALYGAKALGSAVSSGASAVPGMANGISSLAQNASNSSFGQGLRTSKAGEGTTQVFNNAKSAVSDTMGHVKTNMAGIGFNAGTKMGGGEGSELSSNIEALNDKKDGKTYPNPQQDYFDVGKGSQSQSNNSKQISNKNGGGSNATGRANYVESSSTNKAKEETWSNKFNSYNKEPTEKQLHVAKKLGIDTNNLNRGQLGDQIKRNTENGDLKLFRKGGNND